MKIITRWFLALLDGVPTGGVWLDFFWILSKPPSLTIFVLVWPWHSIKFFESVARFRPRMSSTAWWRRLYMAGGLRTVLYLFLTLFGVAKRILTLFYILYASKLLVWYNYSNVCAGLGFPTCGTIWPLERSFFSIPPVLYCTLLSVLHCSLSLSLSLSAQHRTVPRLKCKTVLFGSRSVERIPKRSSEFDSYVCIVCRSWYQYDYVQYCTSMVSWRASSAHSEERRSKIQKRYRGRGGEAHLTVLIITRRRREDGTGPK